ncbi:sigma 54-interacting transcriptional regulator [Pseudomonas sp. GL-B-16]|uniref:sigma 54-interacting transcriptional regulator n=1 Tax=Pseudomonas sp. GL-B-16 TaxID=2832373 RepID=UPI001CBEF572|nr:sigma 54-interacting transcriptional regulator [Pseudomonas sp. GL-B-16]
MSEEDWLDDQWALGDNLATLNVIAQSLAELRIDVLLFGETGSGKDTLAQRIHRLSGRKGPFVAMNCAAIPESLCESELFGVVSGAYTGADRSRLGYIEAAQGGTLYLDEIDSMPFVLQSKLLRVLESRALERLGSTTSIELDICVIASAQCSLEELVELGEFRRDLYFRLNALTLKLPPLRLHRERILPLFMHLLEKLAQEMEVRVKEVDPVMTQVLLNHDWPGNIRELKSAAKRFVMGLPPLGDDPTPEGVTTALKSQLRLIERVLIQESLKRNEHSIDVVSRELDIPRRTLYHRMKELDV